MSSSQIPIDPNLVAQQDQALQQAVLDFNQRHNPFTVTPAMRGQIFPSFVATYLNTSRNALMRGLMAHIHNRFNLNGFAPPWLIDEWTVTGNGSQILHAAPSPVPALTTGQPAMTPRLPVRVVVAPTMFQITPGPFAPAGTPLPYTNQTLAPLHPPHPHASQTRPSILPPAPTTPNYTSASASRRPSAPGPIRRRRPRPRGPSTRDHPATRGYPPGWAPNVAIDGRRDPDWRFACDICGHTDGCRSDLNTHMIDGSGRAGFVVVAIDTGGRQWHGRDAANNAYQGPMVDMRPGAPAPPPPPYPGQCAHNTQAGRQRRTAAAKQAATKKGGAANKPKGGR